MEGKASVNMNGSGKSDVPIVNAAEEVFVKQEYDIPMSPSTGYSGQDHAPDDCPCHKKIKALEETVEQLTRRMEKYDRMFDELKGTIQGLTTGQNVKETKPVQMLDKGTQYIRQTNDELNIITGSEAESIIIKEECESLPEHDDHEQLLDCDHEEALIPFASSYMAASQPQPLTTSVVKTAIAFNDNKKKIAVEQEIGTEAGTSSTHFQCPECFKFFRNKKCLRQHMNRHFKPSVLCTFCKKQFKNKYCMTNHIKSVHKGRQCNFCSSLFMDISSFNCHMKSHLGEKKVPLKLLPARPRLK